MPGFMTNGVDFWAVLGVAGGLLFFGRFYVQWILSELRKQCHIPVSFWYMSIAGTLLLFPYAVYRGSPGGTLGLCFNIVIYTRNLVHIWRGRGRLSPGLNLLVHAVAGGLVAAAAVLTLLTWHRAYGAAGGGGAGGFWLWSVVWVAGQGLFFLRFLVQWLTTEYNRKSVVPRAFWHLSILGTLFHMAYFLQRADWIFAVGTIADGLIYIRNLYLPAGDSGGGGDGRENPSPGGG